MTQNGNRHRVLATTMIVLVILAAGAAHAEWQATYLPTLEISRVQGEIEIDGVIDDTGWGNAEYCLDLNEPLGNIRRTPLKEIMELDRFKQLRVDAEKCSSCNSPTMVDLSNLWENPQLIFERGGIAVG